MACRSPMEVWAWNGATLSPAARRTWLFRGDSEVLWTTARLALLSACQGHVFVPSRRLRGHYQAPWKSQLHSSNKLPSCGIDADIAQHVQNGAGRCPSVPATHGKYRFVRY